MTRIVPSEVPELYRRLGMKPVRGTFGYGRAPRCGCIVGALVIEQGRDWNDAYKAVRDKYGGCYVAGLTIGFDGQPLADTNEGVVDGHADGRAAWEAVVEAGLV